MACLTVVSNPQSERVGRVKASTIPAPHLTITEGRGVSANHREECAPDSVTHDESQQVRYQFLRQVLPTDCKQRADGTRK